MKSIRTILILFSLSPILFAQVDKDSLDLSQHSYKSKFLNNYLDKQLNTYSFSTQLNYNYSFGNAFFGIKELFNSTITNTTTKNIKDEQYLKLFGMYGLSELFKLGVFVNNYIYSDDRSLSINKVANTNSMFFLKIVPTKNIEITPFAGISNNSQINEKDKGFIYGTEANIDNYNLGDINMSSLIKLQNEDISPRKNTLRLINLNIKNSFEENIDNTASAYFSNQRKDFYFTADETTMQEFGITNNIQSRLESNYAFEDRIKFTTANYPLSFEVQGKVSGRDIERTTRYINAQNTSVSAFDTKIKESRLELLTSADYIEKDMALSAKFSFTERDEKHSPRKIDGLNEIIFNERQNTELQKNNTSQLATIALSGMIKLSPNDQLTISLFHRKLKYDTPSDENFDDRDELLSVGRLMYEKRINSFLKAFANLEGSLNQIVYIFSERSANNNVQRIIKFSSGGLIDLGRFRTNNSAEVSANYTVFDYEKLNPNYRSYSFRQLMLRDSTNYQITKRFRANISGYLKLSEQGDFKWTSFSSKPSRYLDERYIEPKILYEYSALDIGIGLRYFSLSNYNVVNGTQKVKTSDYKSVGPMAEIGYHLSEDISFRTYGWYEFITTESNTKREMANFNLKFLYRF